MAGIYFNLSSGESKLVSLALAHYFRYKDPSMLFKVSDLITIMPTSKTNAFAWVRSKTLTLLGKIFEIEEEDGLLQLGWFSSCRYHYGKGMVEFRLNPDLLPYLEIDKTKGFTKYNLQYILPLQSKYAVRMYELFKKIYKLRRNVFSIKEFRAILGVPDDIYPLTADFIRRVVKQCQAEFQKHTDIKFNFTYHKQGRAVTHLEFKILKNHIVTRKDEKINSQLDAEDHNAELQKLHEGLSSFDINDKVIEEIMRDYDASYIYEKMDLVDEYAKKAEAEKKEYNSAALLMKALKEDWKQSKNSRYADIKEQKKAEKEATAKAENEQKQIEALVAEYETYSFDVISKTYDSYSSEKQQELKASFQDSLAGNSIIDFDIPVSELNLDDNSWMANSFVEHIKEQKKISLLSFSEWCEIHTDNRVQKVNGEWKLLT